MSELEFLQKILGLQQKSVLTDILSVCRIESVRKGQVLFQRGVKPSHICLLVDGIFRGFFLDTDGKEITDCLVATPGYPLMPDSDLTTASNVTMEALTDAEVFLLSLSDFFALVQRHAEIQALYQKMMLYSWRYHHQLKLMMYQYSAADRYHWFLRYYPGAMDRISHRYVASFLNMTPVTLSRLVNSAPTGSAAKDPAKLLDLFPFPDINSVP